ncbi:MoxR family ATPase [Curtobacterium sp. VKM Ac-2922]|uniref:AAA family ATPase n=1 Tax=Curtobacterium sp. VKM Ac-2922 TaxID=2929475 RepID=UPI001FB3286C|nr:MoxR family ATPase [Curtobacterium sp. VKM Ac-2922]MCJ1712950.1 MoxR family ATPase [Curtobacterium sp. VKM Ac-2922]
MTVTPPGTAPDMPIADVAARARDVLDTVGSVVVGMREPLELAFASVLAGGHVLFEDVPGLGKTLAARSLAAACGLDFRRLQCTPDLLPADITGSFVYAPATAEFVFRPGPVFAGMFLADEINRTSPKTQSALLEAMAEGQVTVEGEGFPLPRPFHVLATSNPIEYEGTYALPEAQLDRFMVRLSVGYPSREGEQRVLLNRVRRRHEVADVPAVIDASELLRMQASVEGVHVDDDIALYCVDLAGATRTHRDVQVGASPRGAQALMLVGRARAVMDGRDFVTPEDVKTAAVAVLTHRISLTPQAWANGVDPAQVIRSIVAQVPGPPVVGVGGSGAGAGAGAGAGGSGASGASGGSGASGASGLEAR